MTKKLGLALGAGAARGWAHIGVLKGLEEMGIKPDIITGSSVGALVGGAYLIDALEAFEVWAQSLSPLSAIQSFNLQVTKGGFVNTARAFEAFDEFDTDIENLDTKFGAVACDLATGEAVEIFQGSIIHAARASSAIPVLFQAVAHQGRWLVDGAIVNPTPISLARKLGADIVIGVDLLAIPSLLERFDPSAAITQSPLSEAKLTQHSNANPDKGVKGLTSSVERLIADTKISVEKEIKKAKEKVMAKPHVFETALAVSDIMQMHIGRSRALAYPADILLTPDMREAGPNSFDRSEEFIEIGRQNLFAHRAEIETMIAP